MFYLGLPLLVIISLHSCVITGATGAPGDRGLTGATGATGPVRTGMFKTYILSG